MGEHCDLLAKPDTPLIDHSQKVLFLGKEIAQLLRLDEKLFKKALIACALHDIGKAIVDFQVYIRDKGKRGRAYPHALAALPIVLQSEIYLNQKYGWDNFDLIATAAVLTHHSPLTPRLYKGYTKPDFCPELDKALQALWELLHQFGIRELPPIQEILYSPLLQESPAAILDASGIIHGKTIRGVFQSQSPLEFAQVKTVLHLADWLASSKESNHSILFMDEGGARLQNHVARLPSPLKVFQKRTFASRSNILWLRAPTGTGKTEALLLWADDFERLIYLLPTQATVNAMWKRLRDIFGNERVGIAHGRSGYILRQEFDEDPLETRLFGAVFATPITVATLDQYLLAHLHGRHWEEKRSLAHQATVILDEIHAYEPYTLGLLSKVLEQERPDRVAFASATLPTSLLEFFPKGELIEAENTLWQRSRHRARLCEGSLQDALPAAIKLASQGNSVLLVANTINDAQTIYQRLRNEFKWGQSLLLHSRFILRDRQIREAKVESPEAGTIFIATQVVEVSLNISYDALITEVAPIDALVQRMGRVNRRGEKPLAPVYIYRQWSEGSQRVYGKEILEASLALMETLPEVPTDRHLAEVTHRLYEHIMASENWKKEFEDGRKTVEEVQRILGCYTIDLSDEEMRERFTARRGQVSVEVLPASFVQEAYSLKERGEGWRLPELMTSVPLYWLRCSEFFSPLSDLHCIQTTLEYDPEIGLIAPTKGQGAAGYVLID